MGGGNIARPDSGAPTSIQLRHMRYFLAVLEECHFGRAAQRLHMSQPPLSKAIRLLEEALGVQLFQRGSQGVTATRAGMVFGEHARAALATVDVAVVEARRAGGLDGALRLGCLPHFPVDRIQLLLEHLHAAIGAPPVAMTHHLSSEQLRKLGSRELDLAVCYLVGAGADVQMERLFPGDPLEIFFRSDHPLARRDVIRSAELQGEVLWLLRRTVQPALHDAVVAALEKAGYRFEDVRYTGGTDPRDVVLTVAAEGGVTIAPEWFRPEGSANAVLTSRPLAPAVRSPDIAVAWRTGPPAHLQKAIEAARDVARNLYRSSGPLLGPLVGR